MSQQGIDWGSFQNNNWDHDLYIFESQGFRLTLDVRQKIFSLISHDRSFTIISIGADSFDRFYIRHEETDKILIIYNHENKVALKFNYLSYFSTSMNFEQELPL